jgi:hypothetical protein
MNSRATQLECRVIDSPMTSSGPRQFTMAVDREGSPVNDAFLAQFGLRQHHVRALSERFVPPVALYPSVRSDVVVTGYTVVPSKGR